MENTRKKRRKNKKLILRIKQEEMRNLKKKKRARRRRNFTRQRKIKRTPLVKMKRKWEVKEIIYLLSCRKNLKNNQWNL